MSATSSPRKKGAGRAQAARPRPHSSASHKYIAIIPCFSITFPYSRSDPSRRCAGQRGGAR